MTLYIQIDRCYTK